VVGGTIGAGLACLGLDSITDKIRKIVSNNDNIPPLPTGLVGDQNSDKAGLSNNGKRHTSGGLTPENGGTGDPDKDFDYLTGGKSRPTKEGDKTSTKPGARIGDNGVVIRPGKTGISIDIPGFGNKIPETLHYPPR
jgi:filamentous hemagglutinin